MYYSFFITGCQYNHYDAKNLAHLLEKMGYVYVKDDKKADLIVVLACSVRQKPLDRIYGKIKVWRTLPQKPKIIITGCVLPIDKKKLAEKVDAIVKTDDLKKELPNIIVRAKQSGVENYSKKKLLQRTSSESKSKNNNFHPADVDRNTALIPIMQGCNNFCTYCAVPYVRGVEKSRTTNEIIVEIKSELKNGKKHVLLLGQNVNSYFHTLKYESGRVEKIGFIDLIKKIDRIPGNFTFNFLSANPRNFSDELIKLLPKLKKWQHILHLPLQSGDDEILKKMNRKYISSQYLKIITDVRHLMSDVSFTTDLIVGFPEETKIQFENTVKLCKKIGFSKAYVNQYSPRPGTFAAKNFKDNVSQNEKKRRWEVLNKLINKK